jgi:uncharacterized protein YjiS (DUF1127 family)
MTPIALSQLIHRVPAVFHRVAERVAAVLDGIGEARTLAGRYQSLARMSDEELARRGLKRHEIPQVVLGGRFRA